MNAKEWVEEKQRTQFKYFGCCYVAKVAYPFGFCEECWIKEGKPFMSKVL